MLDALYIPGAARTRRACPHGRPGQPGRGRQGEARGRLAGPRSPRPGAGPQSRRAARLPPSGPRAGTPPRYRGKAAACPDPPASSPRAAAGCHAQTRGFTCPRPGLLRPPVPPRQAGSHGTGLGCQGSFPPFAARDIEASLCAGQGEPIKGCLGPEENSGEVGRSCTGPREKRPHSRPRMEPKLRICPGGFPTGVHATEKLPVPGHRQSQQGRTVRAASQGQQPVSQTRRAGTGIHPWASDPRWDAGELPEKHLRTGPAPRREKCHLTEVQKGSNPLQVPRHRGIQLLNKGQSSNLPHGLQVLVFHPSTGHCWAESRTQARQCPAPGSMWPKAGGCC